ncbi:MAG: tryptophan--tRNA ligase [Alphaproteobacteria bacterium]
MNIEKRVLTGIQASGDLHIGNYLGAIKPAIELGKQAKNHNMFIADYHALNSTKDRERLGMAIKRIASTYLAAGIDPSHSILYRQSDVPEIFEITTILANFTPKGFMNKAHSYKARVDKNVEAGLPNDDGINMGLYVYPILMAADILAFDATDVPVGKDQIQHVEIARDIAGAFNAIYGENTLIQPECIVKESVGIIPGVDGRKMSKSYNNVIPILGTDAEIKKAIFSIKTDSRPMEEPKDAEELLIYQIFKTFAPLDKVLEMKEGLAQGKLGYGHIKNMLLDAVLLELKEVREKSEYYMNNYHEVEEILCEGSFKARKIAAKTLDRLKNRIFA